MNFAERGEAAASLGQVVAQAWSSAPKSFVLELPPCAQSFAAPAPAAPKFRLRRSFGPEEAGPAESFDGEGARRRSALAPRRSVPAKVSP